VSADIGVAPAICRSLRAKGAGVAYGDVIQWRNGFYPNAVFWCLHTAEPVGPDDGLVHPHACTVRRACCVLPCEPEVADGSDAPVASRATALEPVKESDVLTQSSQSTRRNPLDSSLR